MPLLRRLLMANCVVACGFAATDPRLAVEAAQARKAVPLHSGKFLIAAGEMEHARRSMTETRLSDGRVLLARGHPNNDHATSPARIYKP